MDNNVYECINISNVINKLGLKKTKQIGNNIYVVCPFCQSNEEKNGYMKANIIKNLFICNKCQSSGTSLKLYADSKYMTTKDAYKQLLKEIPVLDNMPYVFNNPLKDEYYRDLVYNAFLDLLHLNQKHLEKLKSMQFSEEYIKKHKFKSIENNEKNKKEICEKLQADGFKLDGLPGFYQDKDFKWTYKSHKGIFIPAILNNKIQGLRIFLDEKYSSDTENIWFSSNNEYNGAKASNWPIFLKDENMNWFEFSNTNENNVIFIATEIILAHKLFNSTNKTVIGVPNNIDKEVLFSIVNRMKVKEVFVYFDNYTILHTSTAVYNNIMISLEEKGIKTNFRVAVLDDIELIDKNDIKEIKVA